MVDVPARLKLARAVCGWLPPVLARRAGEVIYPKDLARRDDHAFVVDACTGGRYTGSTRDHHGYRFSVHGYFDWRNLAIAIACCREGDTIVEIGANVGTETVVFRDIVGARGKVLAFEPVPSNVTALERLIALNQWTNVDVLPVALCDREGTTEFVLPPDDHLTGIGHIASTGPVPSASTRPPLVVQCRPLDTYTAELTNLRAIFCDTEGAELLVFAGARGVLRRYQPVVVLEAAPRLLERFGTNAGELLALLADVDYDAYKIGRWGLTKITDASQVTRPNNWLCLPRSQEALAMHCERVLLRSALMPRVRGLSPLAR